MLKQPGNVLLWTWELGLYGKSCIFHLWELDDCSLKAARETHRFIFLFITTTSLIKLLHFLKKKTRCMLLLAQKSPDSTLSSNQGTTGMAVNNTEHSPLTAFLMEWYSVSFVFYKALKMKGNMLLWIWLLGPDGKSIFSLWKLNSCSLKPAIETYWFIVLFITETALVWFLSILQIISWFPLAEKSSDSTISPNHRNNKYGHQHTQNTLPWHFFFFPSWNGTVLPRSVITQLWKLQVHASMSLGIGAWGQKKYIPAMKAGELQLHSCQKNTLVLFSHHYTNIFGLVFEFSERNRLLATFW